MSKEEKTQKRRLFDSDGSFYTLTGKLFDLAAVSIYWLIGALPLVTAGAAFSALYAAVVKSVREDRGSISAEFWRAYRRDMKQSFPIWLICAAALFLLMLNYGIFRENAQGVVGIFFQILYSALALFVLTAACYVFPLLSRFVMPFGWHIKLSLYMTVRYLPQSLLTLAAFLICYFLIWKQPLWALILPGFFTLAVSYWMEPLLAKHMPKENSDEEDT